MTAPSPASSSTPTRRRLLSAVVAPRRLTSADSEYDAFASFCHRLQVPVGVDALCLYLTWLRDRGCVARQIQRTLEALDLHARMVGEEAYSDQREVRRYLRGLYRESHIGAAAERCDPLYRELLEVLVTAVMSPTADQLRDQAAILVAAGTGAAARPLARVTWQDVRWTADGARITLPPPRTSTRRPRALELHHQDGPHCPIRALRRLRESTGIEGGYVFGGTGGLWDGKRVRRALRHIEEHHGDLAASLRAVSVSPKQLRNRALLILGYGAALRTLDAAHLQVQDLDLTSEGLLLRVPGRRLETGVPADPDMPCDPGSAWNAWLAATGRLEDRPRRPAFPQINGGYITGRTLSSYGLNHVVQQATRRAQLQGRYGFSSLRIGFIRTALRNDAQSHDIALDVGLRSLQSVTRHERRENLIRHSVAGQLGL